MGGGKGGGSSGSNAAAEAQARIAQQMFQETTPIRNLLFGSQVGGPSPASGKISLAQGGGPALGRRRPGLIENLLVNPLSNALERDVLESQFGRAREDILAGTPTRGGQLNTSLADLQAQRALGVTGLAQAQQQQQMENIFRTFGGVTGTGQVALGGLGQAGSTLAAAGAARQQSQLGALGGLGTGIGTMIGAGKAPGSVKAA